MYPREAARRHTYPAFWFDVFHFRPFQSFVSFRRIALSDCIGQDWKYFLFVIYWSFLFQINAQRNALTKVKVLLPFGFGSKHVFGLRMGDHEGEL